MIVIIFLRDFQHEMVPWQQQPTKVWAAVIQEPARESLNFGKAHWSTDSLSLSCHGMLGVEVETGILFQCGSFALPYICKTVAEINYPDPLHSSSSSSSSSSSNNNNSSKMVLVACTHATTNGSINNVSCSSAASNRGSSGSFTNFWSKIIVSDMWCDIPLVVTDFVVTDSSSRAVVACASVDGASSSCCSGRRRCVQYDRRLDCVKSRKKYQMVLHVPEVIIYAVFVCLLAGACSASCQGEASPSNCSLQSPDSNSTDVGSQVSTVHNFSSSSLYIYPHNQTDLNSVSKTDSGSSINNQSSHVTATEQPILPTGQGLGVLLAGSRLPAKETVGQPATHLPLTGQDEDQHFNKIVSMVVPFVCVIILAIILCVSWMLCRKYKCCHNKACLQKCSVFCDNCMSAPYVFQVTGNVKAQSQLSRDSTGLTLISPHPHISQAHRPTRATAHKPHISQKGAHSSSTSVSRQSSSRSSHSIGYSPVRRQASLHTHPARQSSGPARVVSESLSQSSVVQQTS